MMPLASHHGCAVGGGFLVLAAVSRGNKQSMNMAMANRKPNFGFDFSGKKKKKKGSSELSSFREPKQEDKEKTQEGIVFDSLPILPPSSVS
jgi:hypothetical protein